MNFFACGACTQPEDGTFKALAFGLGVFMAITVSRNKILKKKVINITYVHMSIIFHLVNLNRIQNKQKDVYKKSFYQICKKKSLQCFYVYVINWLVGSP